MATLVAKSWRQARNLQTIKVKCLYGTTDPVITNVVMCCPNITSIQFVKLPGYGGTHLITDTAIISLAEHCSQLITIDLSYRDFVTDTAIISVVWSSHQPCRALPSADHL